MVLPPKSPTGLRPSDCKLPHGGSAERRDSGMHLVALSVPPRRLIGRQLPSPHTAGD